MFGLEYVAALIKVLFKIGFAIVTAIPFTIAWNNLAPKYLSFIPIVYQHIPFWSVVGLLIIVWVLGEQIQQLTPKIISIDQTNNNDNKDTSN